MSLKDEISYIRLNDQDFEFMVALSNQVDRLAPINKAAIVRLIIEEDFRQWWQQGVLVFDNKHNAFERPKNDDADESFSYRFRNDGRDLLIFRLRPVIQGQPDDVLKEDIWSMEYVFSIYDIQDIADGVNADTKYKKLFFWEYEYQNMKESSINWSTAEVLPSAAKNPAQDTDLDRTVLTGDAIQNLLTKALKNKPQQFSKFWDKGASRIQYASHANEKIDEVLQWLVKRHVSAIDNDPCFLNRERFSKKWTLQSLSKIFDRAVDGNGPGEYQIEQFFIDSISEMENPDQKDTANIIKNPAPYKTPVAQKNKVSFERNIQLRDYSVIKSYEFVDMAAMDNMFALTNVPTYSNDIQTKQFNLDYEDNDIINIKDFFVHKYVNKLKHSGCSPDALFTVNKIKNDASALNNVYSLGSTAIERLADGRNEILKAALLLNQCIVFRTKGMSFRTSGRFIGIDREIGATQNEFDSKLLGQWFVINVKHILVEEAYVNEITAVKIHASAPLNINTVEQYPVTS